MHGLPLFPTVAPNWSFSIVPALGIEQATTKKDPLRAHFPDFLVGPQKQVQLTIMAKTSMDKKLRKAMIRKNAKRKEKVQDALAAFIAATAAVIGRQLDITFSFTM